jgi:phenylacetate-CoA ligase
VPDGVEGAVVVTHYRERAMPLVRYWLGDRAIPLAPGCECGSNFRRMMLTRGRSEDFIQLPGDRRIYIGTFLAVGLTLPGIGEFMVRQADTGAITISLVTDPRAGRSFDEVAASIRAMLDSHLGVDVDLDIVETDKVELSAGGKAQLIRSDYRVPGGE